MNLSTIMKFKTLLKGVLCGCVKVEYRYNLLAKVTPGQALENHTVFYLEFF